MYVVVVVDEEVVFVVFVNDVVGVDVIGYFQVDGCVLWVVDVVGVDDIDVGVGVLQYWDVDEVVVLVFDQVYGLDGVDGLGECGDDGCLVYQVL